MCVSLCLWFGRIPSTIEFLFCLWGFTSDHLYRHSIQLDRSCGPQTLIPPCEVFDIVERATYGHYPIMSHYTFTNNATTPVPGGDYKTTSYKKKSKDGESSDGNREKISGLALISNRDHYRAEVRQLQTRKKSMATVKSVVSNCQTFSKRSTSRNRGGNDIMWRWLSIENGFLWRG